MCHDIRQLLSVVEGGRAEGLHPRICKDKNTMTTQRIRCEGHFASQCLQLNLLVVNGADRLRCVALLNSRTARRHLVAELTDG